MSNWTPDDALVEKAARAMFAKNRAVLGAEAREATTNEKARAALIAAYPDMVAEAVKAEAEACASALDAEVKRVLDEQKGELWEPVNKNLRIMTVLLLPLAAVIRARHP